MTDTPKAPNPAKSHHNDSETQIKQSMQGKPANTAEDAQPDTYSVTGNGPYTVVNDRDNSVVAQSGDQAEAQKVADDLNKQPAEPAAQDVQGKQVASKPANQPKT